MADKEPVGEELAEDISQLFTGKTDAGHAFFTDTANIIGVVEKAVNVATDLHLISGSIVTVITPVEDVLTALGWK